MAYKEVVENVGTYSIEGLTVSNAAVKQSNNKVVVLTTAVQEGGKKYAVTSAGKEIGTFEGISTVIPTKIDFVKQSTQGKLGQQITLSADVGVKQAGIPVTFNVKASDQLNKDQVFETLTNADGVATFSYTQYSEGRDQVVAYPTGAPAVRDLGYVFWGVDTILSVEDVTKGDTVNNGANKTYKVKYLDPKTGKPVAGKRFAVSFEENINVNVNQLSKAKVNNVSPSQLLNGTAPEVAVVITDAKGEATFTVTGENTAVTPIVFEQAFTSNTANTTVWTKEYKSDVLQATASKVTFGAVQADYKIEMKRGGTEEAARGLANGREYTLVVTDKEGKVAKNEAVNVAFNEDLDGVIGTETAAQFIKDEKYAGKQITVVTNDKGEASFVIGSEVLNDYATPIAWIDVNSAYANEGKLDKGEASVVGDISYFADAKLSGAALTTYNEAGTKTTSIDASQSAEFKVALTNQSGKAIKLADVGYSHIVASFTVYNTGANVIEVDGQKVSPNRSHTVAAASADSIKVKSVDGKSTSVRVVANGVAKSNTTSVLDYNFTSTETTATFTASTDLADLHTGVVASYNSKDKTVTFVGKTPVKYAGAAGHTYKYFGGNGAQLANADAFITELNKGAAVLTYKVDADKLVTLSFVSIDTTKAAAVDTDKIVPPTVNNKPVAKPVPTQVVVAGSPITLTGSQLASDLDLGDALTVIAAASSSTGVATAAVSGSDLVITAGGAAGTSTITAVVSDGTDTVTVTFNATVTALSAVTVKTPFAPISAATVGGTYTSGAITSQLQSGSTFDLNVDGVGVQTIDVGGLSTADEVAAAINAEFANTAKVVGNTVTITSTTVGTASQVIVANSTVGAFLNATTAAGKVAITTPVQAEFNFTVGVSPAVGSTVKVGNEVFTVVTGAPANAFEVEYNATAATFATNLATAIDTDSTVYSATDALGVVTLKQLTAAAGSAPVVTVQ